MCNLVLRYFNNKIILVLLIHIASDHLYMQASGAETVYIPYQDLERNFPRLFFSYIVDKNIETLVIINGPGSFTQLRIACLTLRLYIQSFDMSDQTAPICIDIPKLSIYTHLIKQGMLPSKWLVFAGQRKKLFWFDPSRNLDVDISDDEMIARDDLDTYIWDAPHRVEQLTDHPLLDAVDTTYIHSPFRLVWDALETDYMWSTLSICIQEVWREVDFFVPLYMMEPKIG